MSKPEPVMLLGYNPSGHAPVPMIGTRTERGYLLFKGSSRNSGTNSFAATRTSVRFTSGVLGSLIPLRARFKAPATVRLSQQPATSLVTFFSETPSNTWTEWENVSDLYYQGRALLGRQSVAGALQWELQCAKRNAASGALG